MKIKAQFVCSHCEAVHPRWLGQCTECKEWNTIREQIPQTQSGSSLSRGASTLNFASLKKPTAPVPRLETGIGELDRVLGGGIVPGSAILLGGDPGVGKSTLLLQTAAALDRNNVACVYVTGEESEDQVRLRATRLGLAGIGVELATSTDAFAVAQAIQRLKPPTVAIIDSIQTMQMVGLDSAPGTVSQVRSCAQELIRAAKERGIPLFLVGHVTKEGALAGPKVLEHMVDTVLYFEGDRGHQYRLIRATKNRFGAADEIGVFSMTDQGLEEVLNPSELFLSERRDDVTGSVVFPGIEGTRPILVEIQALVGGAAFGAPRRAVVGWDAARLAMVLAVLETRCGLVFGQSDVYLNVAGGFRITEPAADLAVAAALVSSLTGKPVPADAVVFGEIGLGGEVRPVGQTELRLREATKLGFTHAITAPAKRATSGPTAKGEALRRTECRKLIELVKSFTDLEATPTTKGRAA